MRRKCGSLPEEKQLKMTPFYPDNTQEIIFFPLFSLCIFFVSYFLSWCLIFSFFQCRWRVRCHPHDQGSSVSHWSYQLGASGHLQVLLLHWCHLLPIWPAELQDEIWLLDIRPGKDRPGALWKHSGPEGGNEWLFVFHFGLKLNNVRMKLTGFSKTLSLLLLPWSRQKFCKWPN